MLLNTNHLKDAETFLRELCAVNAYLDRFASLAMTFSMKYWMLGGLLCSSPLSTHHERSEEILFELG